MAPCCTPVAGTHGATSWLGTVRTRTHTVASTVILFPMHRHTSCSWERRGMEHARCMDHVWLCTHVMLSAPRYAMPTECSGKSKEIQVFHIPRSLNNEAHEAARLAYSQGISSDQCSRFSCKNVEHQEWHCPLIKAISDIDIQGYAISHVSCS